MSETEKKADTPEQARSSFVEPPPPEQQPQPTPQNPAEFPLMKKLEAIRKAIEGKNAQEAHHWDRIATAVEKIAKAFALQTEGIVPLDKHHLAPTPAAKPAPVPAAPAAAPSPTQSFLVDTQANFPQDLQDMLLFEDKGDHIRIKPRQYLGSENFAKIAAIVREIGGEYVSAGKDSHFKRMK